MPVLAISYNWDHIVYDFLWLASFIVFKFFCLLACIIHFYRYEYLCTHFCMDIRFHFSWYISRNRIVASYGSSYFFFKVFVPFLLSLQQCLRVCHHLLFVFLFIFILIGVKWCQAYYFLWGIITIFTSCFLGAVLLCSIQGLAVNIDPVLYTWLIYQPQKRTSRHMQQVRNFYNFLNE